MRFHLTKPIRPQELDELLEGWLQRVAPSSQRWMHDATLAFVAAHNATLLLLIGQFTRRFNQTAHRIAIAVSNIRQMRSLGSHSLINKGGRIGPGGGSDGRRQDSGRR